MTTTGAPAALVDVGGSQDKRNDCSALGQSPVDIDTSRVVDASALSPALVHPLAFRYMSLSDGGKGEARLLLSHHGHHFRVAVPPGSIEWPLGGVLSGGVLRGVSFVDIHVPGEHSVDGHFPEAELQLVHESAGGKPAMAVSVPRELGELGEENEWLKPLLEGLPTKNAAKEVLGQPLGLLHTALNSGATSRYYRYDGSLTKPPCLLTEWFVLEQPGRISQQQLSELGAALGIDVGSRETRPLGASFISSLVMRGSPQLVGQVSEPDSHPIRLRVRRRVQI